MQPGGKVIIADIAFQDQAVLAIEKQAVGDEWEDEFFWLADESITALKDAGFKAQFYRVSPCAGVFVISN